MRLPFRERSAKVIMNPSAIEKSSQLYNGKPAIVFSGDQYGRLRVVAVVSDKRLDLFVQTAYASAKRKPIHADR